MTSTLQLDHGSLVALCGNFNQGAYLGRIVNFLDSLAARGLRVGVERSFGSYLKEAEVSLPCEVIDLEEPAPDTALIISIGGDGAFLRAAQWCGRREIPILGVNTGHLGYLASSSADDTSILLDELMAGRLRKERRALLRLQGVEMPGGFWPYALNEVAITKEDTSSMINIHTAVDGDFLVDYLADGLIISTPTGSTAYNLSLGGPILQPTLDCVILTPSAPHTLTLCPIVVSGRSRIECCVSSRSPRYRISLDGRSFVSECGGKLLISEADFQIVTLRRPGDNFSATLRHKLHWGSR